jgi:tetratricopeptide (TPR) repeat protein
VGEEELGVSLARLSDEVPRTLVALQAYIEEHGGRPAVRLERRPPEPDRAPALAGVAGPASCAFDDEDLGRGGEPVRLSRPASFAALDERLDQAERALAGRQWPEARAALAAAARLSPTVPAHLLHLGDAYAAERRWGEAVRVYESAVAAFPWSASARFRLARALRVEGRIKDSITALARALALRPGSAELRRALLAERTAELVPALPPPAERESGAAGVLWVTRGEGGEHALEEARTYAACKEAFRSSEDLRLRATGLRGPWRWTVGEETACSALWLAAYTRHRDQGRPADPALDGLWQTAQNGQLDERSFFDVGGVAHAGVGALLDDQRRERLFSFVLTHRAGPREGSGFLLF